MLSRIEQKLTALVGDDLVARTHLTVREAPGPVSGLTAGRGAVLVSLGEITPASSFERDAFSFDNSRSRRFLPVRFGVHLDFFMRPGGNSAAQRARARELLLEDMTLVSHGLARAEVVNGKAFSVSEPDPGFRVRSFFLETGTINRDVVDSLLSGGLLYRGEGEVWPPGPMQPEGEILAIDTIMAALPLDITVGRAVVRAGELATLEVRSLPASRLATLTPRADAVLKLAVTVVSDAPPAERGTIAGGAAGEETGFRLIDVTLPATTLSYQAPATGINRTRIEYVAIHLATPDGHRGVFLGSAAIRVEPS